MFKTLTGYENIDSNIFFSKLKGDCIEFGVV